MRLSEVETESIRGLPDGARAIERDRGDRGHLTVVTGPPTCGLTTFLEAIAASVALFGTGTGAAPTELVRGGHGTARVRTTWGIDADERAFAGFDEATSTAEAIFRRDALGRADADPGLLGLMSRYDHHADTSKVVYFPARRVTDGTFASFGDFEGEMRLKRLAGAPDKFAGISAALVKHVAGLGERARFDEVARLFSELVGKVKLVSISPHGQPLFALASSTASVPLRELGFSERNAFVMAAAPVLMGLARSIVLVDTPELGLAPGIAARWMDILRGHFPEAQWIVATRDSSLVDRVEAAARVEIRGDT